MTMNSTKQKVADTILELIGNTPMVRLRRLPEPRMATILAKLEAFNPGGSVKDRICLSMIEDAEARGLLRPGAVIVPPVPMPATNASSSSSTARRISWAVVRRCTSGLAGLRNCCGMNAPGVSLTIASARFTAPLIPSLAGVSTTCAP